MRERRGYSSKMPWTNLWNLLQPCVDLACPIWDPWNNAEMDFCVYSGLMARPYSGYVSSLLSAIARSPEGVSCFWVLSGPEIPILIRLILGSVSVNASAFKVATPYEANPDAKRLYDDLLSNYNRLIRPVVNNSETLTVWLGLKLSQLIEVVSSIASQTQLTFKTTWVFYQTHPPQWDSFYFLNNN